jgi:hypothetical protein
VISSDSIVCELDESPGDTTIVRTKDAAAVEGVRRVVGVACAGEYDTRLGTDGPDA